MVNQAAEHFDVSPQRFVVIGDIGADVGCARAAGARSILVPTAVTLPAEVAAAPHHVTTLTDAVDLVLSGRCR
jgi:beta-phosphoglucomutase-like phosphatase (HAD superfamily)